ncbi:MAG: NTP transferase domain-containing protein [Candidatus Lindowbacteria bacterium]|nr:NTP transferase domain-containing protein [Candidatus Lindowbacteria bacterium]
MSSIRKGIILAGGMGTRLHPLTRVSNKHLLPVGEKPMIYYPIKTLVDAGVDEMLIVLGGESVGDFVRLLGDGSELGLSMLYYAHQSKADGIAGALRLAEKFIGKESFLIMLGDNIVNQPITSYVDKFREVPDRARILLKQVDHPERFGVAEIKDEKIVKIIEKPTEPVSDLAVTGIYMYPPDVFDIIRDLKPSGRGELEITDVNNAYLKEDRLEYDVFSGTWTDAGTFPSLRVATETVWRLNDQNNTDPTESSS